MYQLCKAAVLHLIDKCVIKIRFHPEIHKVDDCLNGMLLILCCGKGNLYVGQVGVIRTLIRFKFPIAELINQSLCLFQKLCLTAFPGGYFLFYNIGNDRL